MFKNRIIDKTDNVITRSLSIFSRRDKKLGIAIVLVNVILGVMDLLGVIAIGLVGSLAVFGISSGKTNQNVENFFNHFGLVGLSFQAQAGILTLLACVLFIGRTVISMFISRRILHFLSRKAAVLSSELLNKLLRIPIFQIQRRSTNEIIYVLDNGISNIALGVIGSTLIMLSDSVLLIVMFVGLLIVNPSVAVITFFSFTMIGVTLFLSTQKRARKIGLENAEFTVISHKVILELFDNYREIYIKNKTRTYEDKFFETRKNLASSIAEQQFLPTIGKYVIESSVILLGVIVSAFQFLVYDAFTAISSLAIFLAAGSRFAPLVMRIQQNALQIKSSSGMAYPALIVLDELSKIKISDRKNDWESLESKPTESKNEKFVASISMKNIEFSYDSGQEWNLQIPLLEISQGSQVAIVGPSGGGKSTLADLLMGVIEPDKGEIKISGLLPRKVVQKWPGIIGYVPQKITAFKGNLVQNVTLGESPQQVNLHRVNEVLSLSHLHESIKQVDPFDFEVMDKGTNLSGGQLQRLGIARALYSNPKVILLDEATSALDGQTEEAISRTINSLKGDVTVLLIAHRLSSVRSADVVIYVDRGRIIASGTFSEVRKIVPNFESQAKLMGL
jgi:ABC-type bacteriocin/lantibiotic exporter with double-glycine peptidase domain